MWWVFLSIIPGRLPIVPADEKALQPTTIINKEYITAILNTEGNKPDLHAAKLGKGSSALASLP